MPRVLVKSYFEKDEKKKVKAMADRVGLTLSEFVRRQSIGARLPNLDHAQTVKDLMKINADLARLGNLFKMAIDEEQTISAIKLMDEIKDTQDLLKARIKDL